MQLNSHVHGLIIRDGRVRGLEISENGGAPREVCYDGVVVATPAYAAAEITKPTLPALSELLKDVRYFPAAVAVIEYDRPVFEQFVLFLGNGTPVRAKLSVGFKEYIPPTKQEQEHPGNRSFPAQTYTVKAGDTLSGIAGGLWDNPTLWRLLADENTIVNPRLLEPGRVLTVPSIV